VVETKKTMKKKKILKYDNYDIYVTMKIETTQIFDKKEDTYVEYLMMLGYAPSVAKVIIYFLLHDEAMSKDIEYTTQLRQPQVSVALNKLIKKGVLKQEAMKGKGQGKGHPYIQYTRIMSPEQIVDMLESEVEEKIKKLRTTIEKIRKLHF